MTSHKVGGGYKSFLTQRHNVLGHECVMEGGKGGV